MLNYKDVVSGKVKADIRGSMTFVQYVGWHDVPVRATRHNFHTIGPTAIILPPVLSDGFRMEPHSSWKRLREMILKGSATATFAELDLISLDLNYLQKLTGSWGGDDFNPLYDERPDWVEWFSAFEDAWSTLDYEIEQLFDRALPHMPPHSSTKCLEEHIAEQGLDCPPIGNRVNPPSLVEALKMMLQKAMWEDESTPVLGLEGVTYEEIAMAVATESPELAESLGLDGLVMEVEG